MRCRPDANKAVIVQAWRQMDWYVQDCSRFAGFGYDAIGHKGGRSVFAEIKDGSKPPSAQKLTPNEAKVHAELKRQGITVELLTCLEDLEVLEHARGDFYASERNR